MVLESKIDLSNTLYIDNLMGEVFYGYSIQELSPELSMHYSLKTNVTNEPSIAKFYYERAHIHYSLGNYHEAMENLRIVTMNTLDKRDLSVTYGKIGLILCKIDKLNDAYEYLKKSINLYMNIGYPPRSEFVKTLELLHLNRR